MTDVPHGGASQGGSPARVVRHHLADRVYHWVMAASVLALLITSFFPIFGWKFPWVAPHWIAGLILTLAVLFHIIRASFWQGLGTMGLGAADVRDASAVVRTGGNAVKPGKYPLPQKLYHHVAATVVLVAIVTGLIMMSKIDTPFWARNPYWLSSQLWGVVYVVHGLSAMATVTLLMAHVYFALRPEKLWMTRSMILGWITRREFADHFDPERWRITDPSDTSSEDETPRAAPIASAESQTTGKPAE